MNRRRVMSRALLSVAAMAALVAMPGASTGVSLQLVSHEIQDGPLHAQLLGPANLVKGNGEPCAQGDSEPGHLTNSLWLHVDSIPVHFTAHGEYDGFQFGLISTLVTQTYQGWFYPPSVDGRNMAERSDFVEDIEIPGGPEGIEISCADVHWANGQGYLRWGLGYYLDFNPGASEGWYYGDDGVNGSPENEIGFFKLTTPDV